jgi:hypothetical protein
MNYLTKQQFAQAKARLTRAIKKGPQAVIDEVNRTYREWDNGNFAYPDDWHRWERARDDAQYEIARTRGAW